jgi:hypothetical protein
MSLWIVRQYYYPDILNNTIMKNVNNNIAEITLETALSIINSLQVVQDHQLESNTQIKCRTRGTIRVGGKAERIISAEQNIKQIGIIDLDLTTESLKQLAINFLMQGEFRRAVNIATISYGVKNTDSFAQQLLRQKSKREEAVVNSPKGTIIRSQSNMVTVLSWRSFETKDGATGYAPNELALRDAETASKGTAITLDMLKAMQEQQVKSAVVETEDGDVVDTDSGEVIAEATEEVAVPFDDE